MTSRTLEVTVISAENLRLDGKPVTKDAYVVVRAESLESFTTTMKDENEGHGSLFSWNEKFSVELGMHARSITFEVKCKTAMGVNRDVGVARIAVSDFLGGAVPDHSLQFLSYRLRDWEGMRNGVINFSVRDVTTPPEYSVPVETEAAAAENITSCGLQNSSNEVVTGIPAWRNSYGSASNASEDV